MKVDRCVCTRTTFAQLKVIAESERLDFDALRAKTGCCAGCRLCEGYVRRMLATGETVFALDATNPAPVATPPPERG